MRSTKRSLLPAAALTALLVWLLWANRAPMVTALTVTSERLPAAFSGFRIAQVSDLHNESFGKENETLLRKLADTNADIIVLTGDLVDCHRTDTEVASAFARRCAELAPTYYVTGNHEANIHGLSAFKAVLSADGVHVMSTQRIMLERNGERIALIGTDDPFLLPYVPPESQKTRMEAALEALVMPECYNLLLAHRPELFDTYAAMGVDLALTGHAHGGQIRLPFIGGVYAPGQGWFPSYDAGLYRQLETVMAVSRGVGNSSFPLRVNNRPEILLVTLQSGQA